MNSVIVNTSNRFDVAEQPVGYQQWERSRPVSCDGNVNRRWISNCNPIAHGAVANDLHVFSWRKSGYGLRGVRLCEASHPGPSQVAATQWDLTARDAEKKMNSPTLHVACRRTRHKVGLSQSLRCKRIYQFPGGTDDWFSFPRKNLFRVTTTSNPLQSIL